MELNLPQETACIRELARQVRELAATPKNERKRARWALHNTLSARQEPLLWVCPDDDGAWLELIPPESLHCHDTDLRLLEHMLRKVLYAQEQFKDDFVAEAAVYFPMPGEYTGYLYGNTLQSTAWGVALQKPEIGSDAYHLNNFLHTDDDFDAILRHEVDFIPDEAETKRLKAKYEDVLDGILAVEFHLPYSVLVQSHLIELVHLRGLEELMYDLYDEPDRLMAILRHMGESKARLLQKLERNRLLFDNRTNIYTGSGGLGYTGDARKAPREVTLRDMWGFADAQEFSSVSPAMFESFAIENQKVGLNLFGMACYGCCEPLTGKYDAVFRHIPALRRLSVSPWTDVRDAADHIGQKAIYSWKPNPADICGGFDEDAMLEKLKEVARITRDCFVEIILKDIRTCGGTPQPLTRFAQLVRVAFNT